MHTDMHIAINKNRFKFTLWKEGEDLFACYQHTELAIPEIPAEGAKIPQGCTSRIQWAYNHYPYLAFIPLTKAFGGELLRPISMNANTIQLVAFDTASREWYCMEQGTKDNWSNLERSLSFACPKLAPRLPKPMNKQMYKPKPSSHFGYQSPFDNVDKARSSINKSRNAFIVLMAYLSFIIAHLEEPNEKEDGFPLWCTALLEAKIQPAWIEKLRACQITDWKLPRMGSIVDLCSFEYNFDTVCKMVERNAQMVNMWKRS